MGSIYCIYSDYRKWFKTNKHNTLKGTKEPITLFIIGCADFDYEGNSDITMYIRDSIYEKLCTGEYHVDKISNPSRKLIIRDKNNEFITPVKEDFCY